MPVYTCTTTSTATATTATMMYPPATKLQQPTTSPLLRLPDAVVLGALFTELSVKDVLHLGRTCKSLFRLLDNDGYWRMRIEADFPHCPSFLLAASRHPGWYRRVYLGLRHPVPFMWGANVALADPNAPPKKKNPTAPPSGNPLKHETWGWMDAPVEVSATFPTSATERGVYAFLTTPAGQDFTTFIAWHRGDSNKGDHLYPVDLVEWRASGNGFVARDSRGGLWGFGKLWDVGRLLVRPTALPLPVAAATTAAGPRAVLVLDSTNRVWQLRDWDKALREAGRTLFRSNRHARHKVVQLAVGHEYSASLMENDQICVWTAPARRRAHIELDEAAYYLPRQSASFVVGTVDVYRGQALNTVCTLPPIPSLEAHYNYRHSSNSRPRIVKIACGRSFIAALKSNGEVWVAIPPDFPINSVEQSLWTWEYLPFFSSRQTTHLYVHDDVLVTHRTPVPTTTGDDVTWASSHLRFAWLRDLETLPYYAEEFDTLPIVEVALGHCQYTALTATGEVYAWGYSHGADDYLDRPKTVNMTPIRRVPVVDKKGAPAMVYSITAGDSHAGALALGDDRIQLFAPPRGPTASSPTKETAPLPPPPAPRVNLTVVASPRSVSGSALNRRICSLTLSSKMSMSNNAFRSLALWTSTPTIGGGGGVKAGPASPSPSPPKGRTIPRQPVKLVKYEDGRVDVNTFS